MPFIDHRLVMYNKMDFTYGAGTFLLVHTCAHIFCARFVLSPQTYRSANTNKSYFSLSLGTHIFITFIVTLGGWNTHTTAHKCVQSNFGRFEMGNTSIVRSSNAPQTLPPSKINIMIAEKCFFTTHHSRATPLSAKRTSNDSSLPTPQLNHNQHITSITNHHRHHIIHIRSMK